EAEAILEDINPSPVQVLGYGVTVYRRVSSYKNAEDLKKDLTLLLGPAKVGAVAYSWIAGKLETNGIGLSTSPSSLDVQNRVLQAAAKLESQPSNAEDPSIAPINEKVDLSEA
ncbi:hypothetical protein Gohar_026704, partial [Gossypium harknessii]|nr:hypothetical protein [Gossypium harknessii]